MLLLTSQNKRIDNLITILIVVVGMIMLITPPWVLQALQDTHQKFGTITAFIVVFLGMVSYTTAARPFESFDAPERLGAVTNICRHAAVLTVFLQFGGSAPTSS
jgi:hypothetical protein